MSPLTCHTLPDDGVIDIVTVQRSPLTCARRERKDYERENEGENEGKRDGEKEKE